MRRPCRILICFMAGLTSVAAHGFAADVTEGSAVANTARMPANDDELEKWLQNMVWYHRFTNHEIAVATGIPEREVEAAKARFKISSTGIPVRSKNSPLLVLPYPGGRHPRIGFLDGALKPQRETKVSVFAPWDPTSYVVIDVPEAIWSNLGLTYLAHTHIDTVWSAKGIELPAQEWQSTADGSLLSERELPNGIVFGSQVKAHVDHVQMEMWLVNGTNQTLSDLRVQNCVMLRAAKGFAQQTNDNKITRGAYVACKDSTGNRWIITAWDPLHRAWSNAPCPCLHSDPKFTDCRPGESSRLRGWFSFYEGDDIDAELDRIEATGWKNRPFLHTVAAGKTADRTTAPGQIVEPDSPDKDYAAELPRIDPVEPSDAVETFDVVPGFEMELVAAEPLVTDPIAAAFDEYGRLFVVEMRGYSEDRDQKLGRVRRLVDSDGDGRFDSATTYVEDLAWPTAVACYDGGIFVGAAPDIIYCKDTDDDGVADTHETVFRGFKRQNVQGMFNTLKWGIDNRLYGSGSTNGGTIHNLRHPDHEPVTLSRNDFVIDPRTMTMEKIAGGGQHGMSFDRWGGRYVSANSDHIQFMQLEQQYLDRNPLLRFGGTRRSIAEDGPQAEVFRASPVEPWRIVRTRLRAKGMVGGPVEGGGTPAGYFTGATGVTIYQGDAFPPKFKTKTFAFVGDVGSNLVHLKHVTDLGLTKTARRVHEGREFVASSDNWFRPSQYLNAPDGTLYVLDMYREVIEHPLSLPPMIKRHIDLTSGRDRGRIYRVVPTAFQHVDRLLPGNASDEQLVEMLGHTNGWHRETAARLLCRRFTSTRHEEQQELISLIRALVRNESASVDARIRAIHCLNTFGQCDLCTLYRCLTDEHPQVRVHALRIAEGQFRKVTTEIPAPLQQVVDKMASDEDLHVRQQFALSLGELPWSARRKPLAELARGDVNDPLMQVAILSSLHEGHLDFLTDLVESGELSSAQQELLRDVVAEIGRSRKSRLIAQSISVLRNRTTPETQTLLVSLLSGLNVRGAQMVEKLREMNVAEPAEILLPLMGYAKHLIADKTSSINESVLAIEIVALEEFSRVGQELRQMIASPHSAIRQHALTAVASYDDIEACDVLLDELQSLFPSERNLVLGAVVSKKSWLERLLRRIDVGTIDQTSLTAAVRQSLLNHRDTSIRAQAESLFGTNADRKQVLEQYQRVLSMAGSPTRGAALFKKNCATCHKLNGSGASVGPELDALRVRGANFFLTNVLTPNRELDPRYESHNIETVDGRVISGIIQSTSDSAVRIIQAEGKTETIERADIEQINATGMSLMPEGLERDLSPQAMADLLSFLTAAEK